MARDRMTWNRGASAAPAVPGYGTEDQDHPAHQPDPEQGAYAKGSPSEWAEDPRQPPYPQGNPPADPGYDVEDKDHPAHTDPPRNPKNARGLQATIIALAEAKADKCLKLAHHMLKGRRGVTAQMVEDQAFSMMDWSDQQITATAERFGGGFLAAPRGADDLGLPPPDETLYMEDDDLDSLLAGDVPEEAPAPAAGKRSEIDMLSAQVKALSDQLTAMRRSAKKAEDDEEEPKESSKKGGKKAEDDEEEAKEGGKKGGKKADQNDPKGPPPKSEDEAKKPEIAAKKAARAFFASMDLDRDGFLMKAEWLGPPSIFAAADKDKDGIVSEDEVVEEMTEKKAGDEVEEEPKEEKKEACGETPMAAIDPSVSEAGLFSAEEQDALGNPVALTEDDAILAEIFGGRRAAKKGEDEPEGDEPEGDEEPKEGGKKAKKGEDEEAPAEEPKEEDAKEGGKKANQRTAGQRPQPRKPQAPMARVAGVSGQPAGEVAELQRLWQSAPDVSGVFNGSK